MLRINGKRSKGVDFVANLFEYLEWRGDLTFEQSELNEVDSLILSWFSYTALDGIVPADCSELNTITIKEAAEQFFLTHDLDKILNESISFTRSCALLLQKLAQTPRFQSLRLTGFVNHIDYQQETQFCAVTVLLRKNRTVVVFRGTDDTLIGWKEDFNMSFLPVIPAQSMALSYLENVAEQIKGKLYVTGHSKGGNLAIYAGVRSSYRVRKRILTIFNNDGPGFYDLKGLGNSYEEMLPKIKTYVPESTIVGMLLERSGDYTVVKSSQKWLYQHDAMSWEVMGTHFVTLETISPASETFRDIVQGWLKGLSKEERERFVDTLYGILETTQAKSLEDLNAEKGKIANLVLREITELDKETRGMLTKIIGTLFKEGNLALKSSKRKK